MAFPRGQGSTRKSFNTRMKDFHDLYSLVHLGHLDDALTEKAIQLVFHHRKTSIKQLPVTFDRNAFEALEKSWISYCSKLKTNTSSLSVPESVEDVVMEIN